MRSDRLGDSVRGGRSRSESLGEGRVGGSRVSLMRAALAGLTISGRSTSIIRARSGLIEGPWAVFCMAGADGGVGAAGSLGGRESDRLGP